MATRVVETGTGLKLDPYNFSDEELINSINQLLYDHKLQDRMKQIAKRIANSDRQAKLCDLIEKISQKKAFA